MNNKFIGRQDVNNTPFSILEFENKTHIIAIGNNRVSKLDFKTKKAAIEYIKSKPWELILNTTFAFILQYNNINTEQQQNPKKVTEQ